MRLGRLFFKIYFWFWAGMLLILGMVSIATMWHGHGIQLSDWRSIALSAIESSGNRMISLYQHGGVKAVQSEFAENQTEVNRYYLFRGKQEITGRSTPTEVLKLVEKVQEDNQPVFLGSKDEKLIAVPIKNDEESFTVVVKNPPMTYRMSFRDLSGFAAFKLISIVIISAIASYILSNYITTPIWRIRSAAGRLASGDLKVRVRPIVGRRQDELADLASDFDSMAERIEELLRNQKQLIADISHELRSPLARLSVALDLCRQEDGETNQQYLDRIELEIARLNELIGQLLSLSRLESGLSQLEKIPVDLAALVKEIGNDANFEAKIRGCEVKISTPDSVLIHAVPELLQRAVENVVRNAIRHTNHGTAVEIQLTDENESVVLSVRDHGPGLSDESDLLNIFQPFFRVDQSRDRKSGGVGLGLAIAERAILIHGGTITATNATDGGLIVVITLRP